MYTGEEMLATFREEYLENPDTFYFEVVNELEEPSGKLYTQDSGRMEYIHNGKRISYVGTLEKQWINAYMRVEHVGKEHYVTVKKTAFRDVIPVYVVYRVLQSERLLAKENAIIIHASYIEYEGRAILFTAPSGTGKSTQADLWKELRGASILNGDRAAIKHQDGKMYACGVPFAGSSDICENATLPLAAVVCLGQAEQTTIRKLKGFEAFRNLYEGCGVITWEEKHVEFVSEFIERLLKDVPIYCLNCTPDESAVIALEKALMEEW